MMADETTPETPDAAKAAADAPPPPENAAGFTSTA